MTHDPLKSERRRIVALETKLTAARDNLRAAAKSQGLSMDGLFAQTEYVPRFTAARWSREAKREGQNKGFRDTLHAFQLIRDAGQSPFARLDSMAECAAEITTDQMSADIIVLADKKRRSELKPKSI
jgi:hypothetical protein